MASYVLDMIALAYGIEPSAVLPMLLGWRGDPDKLTYQQISDRLAEHKPSVSASPQRLAELLLEAQGEDRPAPRQARSQSA